MGKIFTLCSLLMGIVLVSGSSVHGCSDYSCPVECKTCTSNGTCCTCIPGKYGSSCSQDCHYNCLTCSSSAICDTCKNNSFFGPLCDQPCANCQLDACSRYHCLKGCTNGFFETQFMTIPDESNYTKCVKCQQACTTCTSDLECTGCIRRRWSRQCTNQCRGNCDTCDQRTGECLKIECDPGQYLDMNGRCTRCPEICTSCTSATNCTGCVGEHQGKACDSVNCARINHCQECTCSNNECTDIKCIQCEDDYTGDDFQHLCARAITSTNNASTKNPETTNHPMVHGPASLPIVDSMFQEVGPDEDAKNIPRMVIAIGVLFCSVLPFNLLIIKFASYITISEE